MPMILDQGELIEDSDFIIHHLKHQHGVDLDKHLSDEQKAVARAFQLLCEKSIVDIVMYFRWVDKENWPKFREIVFRGAPWLIKVTVANRMAKNIEKTLYKHGTGRFTDSEKLKILNDNLTAISNYLGSKTYFFGDQVSSIDVILFSTLIQVNARGAVRQFERTLDTYPILKNYLERFRQAYWPEMIF
jgi:glutathione S-transferase